MSHCWVNFQLQILSLAVGFRQSAQCGIADAVLTRFYVTRDAIPDARIRCHRDLKVIPPGGPAQREVLRVGAPGVDGKLHAVTGVSVENSDICRLQAGIRNRQRDAVIPAVVVSVYIELRAAQAGYAAIESPEKSIRAVDRQIAVRHADRTEQPAIAERLAGFDRVGAWDMGAAARAATTASRASEAPQAPAA